MKVIRLEIFLFLMSISYNVFAQEQYSRVILKLDETYSIFINQNYIGEKKLIDTTLTHGNYEFKFIRNSDLSLFKIKLLLEADTIIEIKNLRAILFSTNPISALVYVDSIFYGYTPIKILMNPFMKNIELQKRKYKNLKFSVEEINENILNFKLTPEKTENSKYSNLYKYIALGSMIVSGIISSQFKNKANSLYEESLNNPQIKKRVRDYDRISAIFSINMQLSFGIFVYLIMTE